MGMLWVKSLLFAYFVFFAVLNRDAEAVNCSSIKVPRVDITLRPTNNVDLFWVHSLPKANYTVTGCCEYNGHYQSQDTCPKCPALMVGKDCNDHPKKKSLKVCETFSSYIVFGVTVFVNLTVQLPGCPAKSHVTHLQTERKAIKLKPVKNLSLEFHGKDLVAQWSCDDDHDDSEFSIYKAYEIFAPENETLFKKGKVAKRQVRVALANYKDHCYKLFKFCVMLQYCQNDGTGLFCGLMSDEVCAEKRSPPCEPLKPIMLCGVEDKKKCNISKDDTERNITLVWQLPEKSSWNGLAEKIEIKINVKSKERNETDILTITDVNTTHYTLTLKRDAQYQIELIFHSNGGEGPSSEPVILDRDIPGKNQQNVPEQDEQLHETVFFIIVTACIVVIITVVIAFTCLFLRSRRKHKLASLPPLQAPWPGKIHSGTDPYLKSYPTTYHVIDSEQPIIFADIPDKTSFEKLSCNGSSTSESTNDSITCPLVTSTTKSTRDADVTYYPEKTGEESASLMKSCERTSDV